MRIAIVGSRKWSYKLNQLEDAIQHLIDAIQSADPDAIVVSGGAVGADTVAEQTARAAGLGVLIFPAQWDRHGKSAGFIRNRRIVEHADRVVAYWNGTSRGAKNTIDLAVKAKKPVMIYYPDGRRERR